MTEQDWLTSEDPSAMMAHLEWKTSRNRNYQSDEYSTSKSRRNPPLITVRQKQLWVATCRLFLRPDGGPWRNPVEGNLDAVIRAWLQPCQYSRNFAELLREIVGNPFRDVAFKDEWRTPTVADLACGIREREEFDLMPRLGDALEDVGCEDEEILRHCRGLKRQPGKRTAVGRECPVCGLPGRWRSGVGFDHEKICMNKKSHLQSVVWEPHGYYDTSDAWVDIGHPHVRGCWVLEMILQSEDK